MKSNLANIISASRGMTSVVMLFFPVFSVPFWVLYCWGGVSDITETMHVIETKRLILREWQESDATTVLWGDYFLDNPASVKVMMNCGFVDTGQETLCPKLEIGGDKPVRVTIRSSWMPW